MNIKTKIKFKEYLKLLYGLTYRKPVMVFLLFVDLLMIIWICGYYSHLLPLPKPTIYQFITLILISIVQPLGILYTIRRNFNSNNHLRETLEIELNEKEIKIQGETFFTAIEWDNIFKIKEYSNWFLIYQNTFSAIVIPKNNLKGSEEEEFKMILKGITKVPVHLKKSV